MSNPKDPSSPYSIPDEVFETLCEREPAHFKWTGINRLIQTWIPDASQPLVRWMINTKVQSVYRWALAGWCLERMQERWKTLRTIGWDGVPEYVCLMTLWYSCTAHLTPELIIATYAEWLALPTFVEQEQEQKP